jgi:phage protein U
MADLPIVPQPTNQLSVNDYLAYQYAGLTSKLPIASWLQNDQTLYAPTTNSGVNNVLYQWGPIQFIVVGLNTHELDHDTETDWAHKEIVNAAIYREWVGENDETLYVRGRVFPYRIQGMTQLEAFELQRRSGITNQLIRGDGLIMGWFACQKLVRGHTFLSAEGVGQQIAFETVLVRVPVPPADDRISQLWGTMVNPQGLG